MQCDADAPVEHHTKRERLRRGANPFEMGPRTGDPYVNHGQAVFGGLPVSRLRGQAVVKPFLPDFAGFLPQAESSLASEIGHSCSGVIAPRWRGQRTRASPPFRLEIMRTSGP